MSRPCILPPVLLVGLAAFAALSPAQEPSSKVFLLNIGKGQTFTDIGSDDKTTPEAVNSPELDGKALKVAFSPGDSVGDKSARVKNWKPFSSLRCPIFNPGKSDVVILLNIFHTRTTNYNTRVVVPLKLKPGKNDVNVAIDGLANVNGSGANLTSIKKWYFADDAKKAPTLHFGDIWLEGSDAPPTPGSSSVQQPLVGYRVKGKIGTMPVDLTVTPFVLGCGPAQPAAKVHGDPARLERIRKERMPKITQPTLFHTPEADAICSALEVFPENNPWNLVIDDWPLHHNSKNMIASVGMGKPLRVNSDMGFVLIPPSQKKVPVKIVAYPGESDKGPFPVADNIPIEGWPVEYKGATLESVQRKNEGDKDRHAIVVDPTNRMLYEFYQMRKTDAGWQAAQASIFDLKSNKMRPDGWTSTDAAGLPIYPSIIRYDELKRGSIEHAMRVTIVKSRRAYVYPATHYASKRTDENLPRMGERIRLRKDVDISGFSRDAQTILKGLKKYGMFVADNGIDWALSLAPDPRIKSLSEELRKIQGSAFEVVTPPAGYKPPEE